MTLYRDDIQETIAYSNVTLSKTKGLTNEVIRIREDSLHRLAIFAGDIISLTDEIRDSAIFPTKENVSISEILNSRKIGRDYIFDEIIVSDQFKNRSRIKSFVYDNLSSSSVQQDRQRANCFEPLNITEFYKNKKYGSVKLTDKVAFKEQYVTKVNYKDFVQDGIGISELYSRQKIRTNIIENVGFNENYRLKKITKSIVNETTKLLDRQFSRYTDHITDSVLYSEQFQNQLVAKQMVVESLSIHEQFKQLCKVKQFIHESLSIADICSGKNIAQQFINDLIFLDESESTYQRYGFAWTANVDTWAMSRYQDYGYRELVVIDGVLYGVADDGVYRLDADTMIDASLITGQLDLGQGSLIDPVGAYLEYELAGDNKKLMIGVTTTQSGSKQTYYYNLPKEPANYLTNGRVLFGKGLRGRHFSFEIKIGGMYGYINDFSLDIAGTKRRV